jgi:DNA-binding LacI/PurR family transcriptional regulator
MERGRKSSKLAASIRVQIKSGRVRPGEFLPPVRELAEQHGVAYLTARRALLSLADEKYVVSHPGHGYRVLDRPGEPEKGFPLVYVWPGSESRSMDASHQHILAGLTAVAQKSGWSVVAIGSRGLTGNGMMERLRAIGACGAVLDTRDSAAIEAVVDSGLPAVMVDAWTAGLDVDVILQDAFGGGLAAAEYLIAKGHKRIGIIGPERTGAVEQVLERHAGALAGIARAGLKVREEDWREAAVNDHQAAYEAARSLLSRRDRPTAVLALWQHFAISMARAASDLGVKIGRDIDMVGWCKEEEYEGLYVPGFSGHEVPPAVMWSVGDMASTAMRQIAAAIENGLGVPLRSYVPARVVLAAERRKTRTGRRRAGASGRARVR